MNARIEKIGLFYARHSRELRLKMELDLSNGWSAQVFLPMKDVEEFALMMAKYFSENIEDGAYLEDLTGKIISVKFSGDGTTFEAIGGPLSQEKDFIKLSDR
jgi:hypothetical protein